MGGLILVGLIAGAILLLSTALVSGLSAWLISKMKPSLTSVTIVRLSAAVVPVFAGACLLLMIVTPIGVDDNGPQIQGGIIIALGFVIFATFSFSVGSVIARFVLGLSGVK